jgi:hypothetical protein
VDLRAGLDYFEKRKFLTLPGLELRSLGCPVRSLEVQVFIARCWETSSALVNSLAMNHVTSFYAVSTAIVPK